ncbi:MAG: hypothetical protein ACYTFI_28390, partial [Planctomycetota bacterium]
REIATQAAYFEMKARTAYGDTLRGGAAKRQYQAAAKIVDDLMRILPSLRQQNMGKAMLIEKARAYCKAGEFDKGRRLLEKLIEENRGSWVEDLCIDIMGEQLGGEDPALALRAAENLRVRGPAYLFKAIQKYRRALSGLKAGDPNYLKDAAKCWYGIGWCYYYQNRYFEAIVAFERFDRDPFVNTEEAVEASMRKLHALRKLRDTTEAAEAKKEYEDYKTWVSNQPHLRERVGDSFIRDAAIGVENEAKSIAGRKEWKRAAAKYTEAVQKWRQIAKAGGAYHEEGVFNVGFNNYQRAKALATLAKTDKGAEAEAKAAYEAAIQAFEEHIAIVEKPETERTGALVKRVIGSILFCSKSYTHTLIDQPEKALKVTEDLEKRFPQADPLLVISIMRSRVEARVSVGDVEAAELDLQSLKAKVKKEKLGQDHYERALGLIAESFREQSGEVAKENPRKGRLYERKAALYSKEFYDLNPTGKGDWEKRLAMASILFDNAEIDYQTARDKDDKEAMLAARNLYKEA